MSDRHIRESTKRLRKCYPDTPTRSKKNRDPRTRTPKLVRKTGMATPAQVHVQDQNGQQGEPAPGQRQQSPPAGQTTPPQGPQPGPPESPKVPNNGAPSPPGDPHTNNPDFTNYVARLKALEDKQKEREKARAKRGSSKTSSLSKSPSRQRSTSGCSHARRSHSRHSCRRSRRSGSRRSHARSRSRHRSTHHDDKRSRTRSPKRGYSPSSYVSSKRCSRSNERRRARRRSRSASRKRSAPKSPQTSTPRRTTSRSRSRSTKRSRSTHCHSRRDESPRARRGRHQARAEAEAALEKQYPIMGQPKGKHISRSGATLQPYRNLPPDIKRRASDRRSRRDLTMPEHMCGLLGIALKAMDSKTEAYAVVEHASQVAQDATTIQWPTVRAWSQSCLAHIEEGTIQWGEKGIIKDERMRLCWCRGKSQPDTIIPCPEFNTGNCPEKNDHSGEGRTWAHQCGVCFYGFTDPRYINHTASGCRKKAGLKLVTDDGRQDNRRRNNQGGAKRDDKADRPKPKN